PRPEKSLPMFHLRHWTAPQPCIELNPLDGFGGVPKIAVGGLPIAVIRRTSAAELIIETAIARRDAIQPPLVVASANARVVTKCTQDKELLSQLLESDLILADGISIVFASRLANGAPLPERVRSYDLFHETAELAQRRGARFYLLGGSSAT